MFIFTFYYFGQVLYMGVVLFGPSVALKAGMYYRRAPDYVSVVIAMAVSTSFHWCDGV